MTARVNSGAEDRPKDRRNNKCRIWFTGTQRGRESFRSSALCRVITQS
jgi:hypothetical protein